MIVVCIIVSGWVGLCLRFDCLFAVLFWVGCCEVFRVLVLFCVCVIAGCCLLILFMLLFALLAVWCNVCVCLFLFVGLFALFCLLVLFIVCGFAAAYGCCYCLFVWCCLVGLR